MNQALVVSLAILATCVSTGYALECYECQEGINPLCKDPFGGKVPTIECDSGEECLKLTTPAIIYNKFDNIPEGQIRGCASPSKCNEEPSELRHLCHTCSKDLCNFAVTISPSFINMIVLYIVKLMVL